MAQVCTGHAAAGIFRIIGIYDNRISGHDLLGCAICGLVNAAVCLLRCVSAEGVHVLPFSRAMRLLFAVNLDSVKPLIRSQPARLSQSNAKPLHSAQQQVV